MLSDVSIKNIEPVFDTQLMQGGHDFGFVLAASRFFEHVLLPAMPQAYRGSNASAVLMGRRDEDLQITAMSRSTRYYEDARGLARALFEQVA